MPPVRILPDGCVELVLNFGTPFRELLDDGQENLQPMYFVVGQMTRPMVITSDGGVELIGIRFQPGGTLPFFPIPIHELTNQVVELGLFSRELEHKLVSQVGAASSLPRKIALLEQLLVEHVRESTHDSWLVGMARRVVQLGGQVSVDRLAVEAGVSGRQLERRFQRDVGVGPKLLCRILRFQQVFRSADRNDAGWADVAADCGYYDQAHLIRDFQQFAGQTPSVLFSELSQLTHSFTRRERMSDFSNTQV